MIPLGFYRNDDNPDASNSTSKEPPLNAPEMQIVRIKHENNKKTLHKGANVKFRGKEGKLEDPAS